MITTHLETTHPRSASRWIKLTNRIGEWRRHARSRSDLMSLGDATLIDIGLSRCHVEFQAVKPFWMA